MEDFKIWCSKNIKEHGKEKKLSKKNDILVGLLKSLNIHNQIDYVTVTTFDKTNCGQKFTKKNNEFLVNLYEGEIFDTYSDNYRQSTSYIPKNSMIPLKNNQTLIVKKNRDDKLRINNKPFIRLNSYYRIFLIIKFLDDDFNNKKIYHYNKDYEDFCDDIEDT